MKKALLILIAVIGFGISVNAQVVFRGGPHKVCSEDGTAELTLSGSSYIFWYDGQKIKGQYNVVDGYLNLYEDGVEVFSFKYKFDNGTNTLWWVDVTINNMTTRLAKGRC